MESEDAARRDPCDQAGGCAAVSHIQKLCGRLQTVKTFAMYDHRIVTVFDFDPEITETMDRGAAVGALQKIMYDRCAFAVGANIIQR